MKHTPGPWTVEQDEEFDWRYTIRGPYPEIPNATYALLKTLGNGNNNEGNARLAAAAPEMVDLLRQAWLEMDNALHIYIPVFSKDGEDMAELCGKIEALLDRIGGEEART